MTGRPLGRAGHARVDWLTAPALLLAARAAGLRGAPLWWARCFAGLIVLAVSTTRTPLGVVRVVPWAWHGRAEFVSVLVQAALPFTRGFAERGRGRVFFLVFAAYNLLVWRLTDWRAPMQPGDSGSGV